MRPMRLSATTRRRHCPLHGKRRFRSEAHAIEALTRARFTRRRIAREVAQLEYGTIVLHRRECRAYPCSVCGGWHTTSRA